MPIEKIVCYTAKCDGCGETYKYEDCSIWSDKACLADDMQECDWLVTKDLKGKVSAMCPQCWESLFEGTKTN